MITNEALRSYAGYGVAREYAADLTRNFVNVDGLRALANGDAPDAALIASDLRKIEMEAVLKGDYRAVGYIDAWLTAYGDDALHWELSDEPVDATKAVAALLAFTALYTVLVVWLTTLWGAGSDDTMPASPSPLVVTAPMPAPVTHTWDEGDTNDMDVKPGDTVNIIMTYDGGAVQRCEDMGGTLAIGDQFICHDVDF